jgi:hypothetical protein
LCSLHSHTHATIICAWLATVPLPIYAWFVVSQNCMFPISTMILPSSRKKKDKLLFLI